MYAYISNLMNEYSRANSYGYQRISHLKSVHISNRNAGRNIKDDELMKINGNAP